MYVVFCQIVHNRPSEVRLRQDGSVSCARLCAINASKHEWSCPLMSSCETCAYPQNIASQGIRYNSLKGWKGGNDLANRCLRPLGHLSTDLSSMRGSQSSAT